mgnify:CR=1 FL=1
MFFHADEVVFLAVLQEGHAFAHFRVADNHPWLGAGMITGGIECPDQCLDVVAIHPLGEPAKGLPAIDNRFEREDFT